MARIPRIYTAQALGSQQQIALEPGASHHILKVLRMSVGRTLIVFNGDGNEYAAEITASDKKTATVLTGDADYQPRVQNLNIELAIALSKGDRFDWVLQKATELGVNRIFPLFSERSEVKLSGERIDKKHQSWQQIIIAACEQCQRNILPVLEAPQALDDFLPTTEAQLKFVLHHRSEHALSTASAPSSVCLLIGPEGGLSENEIVQAQNAGFIPLTLGPRVLRTETAPLSALAIVQYLWGDLAG